VSADLGSSSNLFTLEVAKKHGVGRSELRKRFNPKAASAARYHDPARLLSHAHERELLEYTERLCEHCLPPKPISVANIAQGLRGRTPSKNWATRIVARHKDQLDARYTNKLGLA
jgi:hypothetical protein